jgi:nicotinate-nucleotide pyrophosphorylase (carboxylating)
MGDRVVKRAIKPLDMEKILPLIQMAVQEDFGQGDPTSEITFAPDETGKASLVTREEIVVCGMELIREVLKCYDEDLKLRILIEDGCRANVANRLGFFEGPFQRCSAERVALNFSSISAASAR